MRLLRTLAIFELGAWVGMVIAAAFVKRALPSRGDEESDDVSLVAVFDGVDLRSRAKAFRGGSVLAWFGGVDVDLREAELEPGAQLSLGALFGGVAIKVPPGWRIDSRARAFAGGVDVRAPDPEDPAAPTLTLDGLAVCGGIAVAAGPAEEGAES
jgi:hypothetical protein